MTTPAIGGAAVTFVSGQKAWNAHSLDDLSWFWEHVEKTASCWLWRGYTEASGYGSTGVSGKRRKAHVIAWEAVHGPKPDGKELDHLCRVRRCVRPDHLEAVTHRVNSLRGVGPTAANAAKDECDNGHQFDGENTYWRRNGNRDCRACRRARGLAYYYRKQAA